MSNAVIGVLLMLLAIVLLVFTGGLMAALPNGDLGFWWGCAAAWAVIQLVLSLGLLIIGFIFIIDD